jgi:hypothetical protein
MDFTRKKGLEITAEALRLCCEVDGRGCADETTTITWDDYKNPPGTALHDR